MKLIVNEELRFLTRYGVAKKPLDSISNRSLMTFNSNQRKNKNIKYVAYSTNYLNHNKSTQNKTTLSIDVMWQKNQQDKIDTLKKEQLNIKKDVDYVKTLQNWEHKFLPKIK